MRRLVLATHNPGKVREWRQLLAPFVHEVVFLPDLPEVPETAPGYAGNALLKAHAAATATGLPALGDDTGLELLHLQGLPGPHTKRFAMRHGGWRAAAHELLRRLGERPPAARMVCALALVGPDGSPHATGQVEGALIAPCGEGPGFTPAFRSPAHNPEGLSWAQLGPRWRQQHDHRAAAFQALRPQLGWGE